MSMKLAAPARQVSDLVGGFNALPVADYTANLKQMFGG